MSKWLVKIQGYEYETNIDELKQWVIEGRVLPEDMIFRQVLGWRIAREVPMLREAFEEQKRRPPSQKETTPPLLLHQSNIYQNSHINQHTSPTLSKRWRGYSIDMFSYSIFAAPGFLLLELQEKVAFLDVIDPEEVTEVATTGPYSLIAIGALVSFGLNVYLTSTYGGTVGKRLMGTVVLDRESKTFISLGKSTIREALRMILCSSTILVAVLINNILGLPVLALLLAGIFSCWLIFDTERRQIYDLILGSNVYDDLD